MSGQPGRPTLYKGILIWRLGVGGWIWPGMGQFQRLRDELVLG